MLRGIVGEVRPLWRPTVGIRVWIGLKERLEVVFGSKDWYENGKNGCGEILAAETCPHLKAPTIGNSSSSQADQRLDALSLSRLHVRSILRR